MGLKWQSLASAVRRFVSFYVDRCAIGEINARYHFKRINVNDACRWINAAMEDGVEQIRVLT